MEEQPSSGAEIKKMFPCVLDKDVKNDVKVRCEILDVCISNSNQADDFEIRFYKSLSTV
jgi:hypothetical protein